MGRLLSFLLLFYVSVQLSKGFVITESEDAAEKRLLKKRSTDSEAVPDIEIYSLQIDCTVTSRFAHNVITSRVANRANVSKEVTFDVELPKTAFITNFNMIIDGVTYAGVVKEKEVAQKQYQQAVSRGQTAGLVKATAERKVEKFTVSVNIAAASKITFELIYEELLQRNVGKYELFIRVKPKQLVKHFQIEAHIFEPQGIRFLNAEGTFITNELTDTVQTSFSGPKGHVRFKPTFDQQRSCPDCQQTILDGDFLITYDVERVHSAGELQIVNGYFVHFFAPENLPRVPKNVIFVVDVSGSMRGTKIAQTREALTKILDDVIEEDHFNFVIFSTSVSLWKTSLVKATPETLKEAKEYVASLEAQSFTNINDAVLKAVELLEQAYEAKEVPEKSASIIIFLTDGDPTSGETNTEKIQENVRNVVQGKYSLYSLGFGNDLDYNFLEKLSLENKGIARRIYESSDAALQLQGFYSEVANPLLLDVDIQYPEDSISDLTETNFKHYYKGGEVVVAGRISDSDLQKLTANIKAQGAAGDITLQQEATLGELEEALKKQQYIFGNYTERLWAYLTIKQLLQQRISAKGDLKANLTAQALEMSLKYNFVTPLTSMVVTKPEDKQDNSTLVADKPIEGERYRQTYGHPAPVPAAGTHHSYNMVAAAYPTYHTAYVDSDPHFVIEVPSRNDIICFNINEKPGVILNLVRDPATGVTVNGQIIGNKKAAGKAETSNTYFGKFGIIHKPLGMKIEVTPEVIAVHSGETKTVFSWMDTASLQHESLKLVITKETSLSVTFGDGATIVILLHRVWKKHPLHQDFLGLYTLDERRFSTQTHGLLGQFFHDLDFEVYDIHPGSDPGKSDATMIVKGNKLTVTRGKQIDYRTDLKHGTFVPCWFIHNNGKGLINGVSSDYVVSTLFDTM
ncbi:inter-alpha-trypsin inhibitor heavy chain H3-like isoform X2 [Protopterus annectens]|uniref:inter-alpha-trypsin inhibitor heavy chain H3-like isoform X2 n=1 Tax=Protopterus annectens TaxID=7888 RepID=UPI001CFBB5D1|nr:inter-alpha-trypsin inhibitor heavy chain H3-like isoform X2 [Protopterus annectens]